MLMIGLLAFAFSNLTAAAGTAITALLPPSGTRRPGFTRLNRIMYRCAGTPHTITVMKAFGRTTLASAVAASGTSITLATDPGAGTPSGNLANGDWLCIELDDGSFFLSPLSSLSTLTMTVNSLPAAAAVGNRVWTFGVPGDHTSTQTNPRSQNAPLSGGGGELRGGSILCTASIVNDVPATTPAVSARASTRTSR